VDEVCVFADDESKEMKVEGWKKGGGGGEEGFYKKERRSG
jgi:hypothetical protein